MITQKGTEVEPQGRNGDEEIDENIKKKGEEIRVSYMLQDSYRDHFQILQIT